MRETPIKRYFDRVLCNGFNVRSADEDEEPGIMQYPRESKSPGVVTLLNGVLWERF